VASAVPTSQEPQELDGREGVFSPPPRSYVFWENRYDPPFWTSVASHQVGIDSRRRIESFQGLHPNLKLGKEKSQ
jgi:hypothetical protein